MSQRLTRKEIKHDIRDDEVRHALLRIFDTLVERPSLVIGAVGGVLALILAATGVFAYLDHRRQAANEKLAEAIEIASAPLTTDDAAPGVGDGLKFASEEERRARAKQAFEAVRESVGSGVPGEVAGLYLADIAATEGDVETARKIWQDFLAGHGDHALALNVRINVIHLDRESGRAQEVADDLRKQLDGTAKKLPEDVILYELAQTLEVLERDDEAQELYQRILDEHPRSPYAEKARQATS